MKDPRDMKHLFHKCKKRNLFKQLYDFYDNYTDLFTLVSRYLNDFLNYTKRKKLTRLIIVVVYGLITRTTSKSSIGRSMVVLRSYKLSNT